jgi:hypothetical protein
MFSLGSMQQLDAPRAEGEPQQLGEVRVRVAQPVFVGRDGGGEGEVADELRQKSPTGTPRRRAANRATTRRQSA